MNKIFFKKGSASEMLALLTILALSLSVIRVMIFHTPYLLFLIWNGFLAWLPFLCAMLLVSLYKSGASNYKKLIVAILWLLLLPNSFYVITDFIHITPGDNFEALYDIVLVFIYSLLGILLGVISLKIVQDLAYERKSKLAKYLPLIIMPLVGFAIYVGRYWRWNSWDLVIRPHVLVQDFIDIITEYHTRAITITVLFAVVYLAIYYIFIRFSRK
jgi:uncharacterized membrane protein